MPRIAFMPYRTMQKDGTVAEGFARREIIDALHGPTGNKEPLIVESPSADHSSQGSGAWTSDSPAPGSATASSARPTSGAGGSSPATGPGSPSGTTSGTSVWRLTGDYDDPTLIEDDYAMLAANPMSDRIPFLGPSTSSQAGSRARTSQSPDGDGDSSTGNEAACSSSSHGSLTLWSHQAGGSSSRTFPDSFPQTVGGISPSFSRRWPTSGSWTGPGECWTHDSSESPSAGGASSSLPDVLEENVHERYFLSPKAAAGILRRATRRGRVLPPELEAALTSLAASADGTGRASTPPSTTERLA